jgi:hypothetical protein
LVWGRQGALTLGMDRLYSNFNAQCAANENETY